MLLYVKIVNCPSGRRSTALFPVPVSYMSRYLCRKRRDFVLLVLPS